MYVKRTPPDLYAAIVNRFMMMCLSHHDQCTVKEDLGMKKGLNACKYKSPACATYKLLLKDPLPPQLAPSAKDETKVVDKQIMGSFKSHADYDTLNNHNSFKSKLIESILLKAKELIASARNTPLDGIF